MHMENENKNKAVISAKKSILFTSGIFVYSPLWVSLESREVFA